ncbi:MAG TPA: NAD(P)H-hydrate dehydratase [Solirubrobacteraceae bacterium]
MSRPLRWLRALPGAEASREADRHAIEDLHIASLDLMERASEGLAALVGEVAPDGVVAVACGGGNNGGDGYAAARLLRAAWREVRVLAAVPVERLGGDARVQVDRLPGEPPRPFTPEGLDGATVIVDALLGTGFSGVPRGAVGDAIAAIEAAGIPVVATDVPSGVDASTGEVAGAAVRAVATATFHAPKPGLCINPGKARSGRVRVIDIGIPARAAAEAVGPGAIGLIDDDLLLALLPARAVGWTKFTSGHVLVAGGSRGLTGAVVLASEAAMRAGAGYVSACVPGSQQAVVAAHLVEVMQLALVEEDGGHSPDGVAAVLEEAARRGGALVLGPGLGRTAGAQAFARDLAAGAQLPLLLDADGLNAHAGHLEALAGRGAPTVLTPHAGELGRLLGVPSADVEARRLEHVRRAAQVSGAVVVLKGDDTLVARPDGTVAVSPGATPALATAGTGDVLSGVTGALLARGIEPFTAACAAVRLHARAGVRAAAEVGADGVIARDVIAALPGARP